MTPGNENQFLLPLKVLGGVVFGYQVHNHIHTDDNFLQSVVKVHVNTHQYEFVNKVVAYFCFQQPAYQQMFDMKRLTNGIPYCLSEKLHHTK